MSLRLQLRCRAESLYTENDVSFVHVDFAPVPGYPLHETAPQATVSLILLADAAEMFRRGKQYLATFEECAEDPE